MSNQKGSGAAGKLFTRDGRIREWEGMKACGQREAKVKMMPDGNGQCKMGFRRPGSNKNR